MIGIIDAELWAAKKITGNFLPNLEVMKIYAHYSPTQSVRLLMPEDPLNIYHNIYVVRAKESTPFSFQELAPYPTTFIDDKGPFAYSPMSKALEEEEPTYAPYRRNINRLSPDGSTARQRALSFLDAQFARLHMGQEEFPRLREGTKLYLYDKDLLQGDYLRTIDYIKYTNSSSLHLVYPLRIDSREKMEQLIATDFPVMGGNLIRRTMLAIDVRLTLKEWDEIIKANKVYFYTLPKESILLPTLVAGETDWRKSWLLNFYTARVFASHNLGISLLPMRQAPSEWVLAHNALQRYLDQKDYTKTLRESLLTLRERKALEGLSKNDTAFFLTTNTPFR